MEQTTGITQEIILRGKKISNIEDFKEVIRDKLLLEKEMKGMDEEFETLQSKMRKAGQELSLLSQAINEYLPEV